MYITLSRVWNISYRACSREDRAPSIDGNVNVEVFRPSGIKVLDYLSFEVLWGILYAHLLVARYHMEIPSENIGQIIGICRKTRQYVMGLERGGHVSTLCRTQHIGRIAKYIVHSTWHMIYGRST